MREREERDRRNCRSGKTENWLCKKKVQKSSGIQSNAGREKILSAMSFLPENSVQRPDVTAVFVKTSESLLR